jgi:hypothetical protein
MKIDFIRETKADGDRFYFTRVNGNFVDGSLAFDSNKAKIIYDNIVKNKGKLNLEEVLESVEIEVAK